VDSADGTTLVRPGQASKTLYLNPGPADTMPWEMNDGTKSSGTYTPTAADGNFRMVTNGGAFTWAVDGDTSKAYTLVVWLSNSATAGVITFSGWNAITGDPLTTTNGAGFLCSIVHFGGIRTINIQQVA